MEADINVQFGGRAEKITLTPKMTYLELEALCLRRFGLSKDGSTVDIVVVDSEDNEGCLFAPLFVCRVLL